MADQPSGSRGSTPRRSASLANITPSKVPSKVASKVMSAVDLAATKAALMQPLQIFTGQTPEFDPHEHRNVPNPTSYSDTMTHLLKACFGVGMLAMPHAFSRLGLVFGTFGAFFLAFFATYCIQLLVLAQYKICKKHKVGYLSYPKTMRIALKEGPPFMRWTAAPFAFAVDGFLIVWQIGVCAVFLVFAAENIREVLHYCGADLSVRILICCMYPPLVLLCLIKSLKMMAPLSTFSNVCNLFGLALVFYYLIHDDLVVTDDHYKLKGLTDIPVFVGIVLYALEAVGVILALEYNMENPKEFTGWCGLFSVGMTIIVVIYTVLGVFGYLKYGMAAKASVTLNLPQSDKKAQVAHAAFAATIFTSFPLQNYVAWQIIWGMIEKKFSDDKKRKADMAVRVGCCTVPFVLAVAAPTLGPFIGLLGSLCLATAAILFPAVLDISVYYPNEYGFCSYKLITDIFIILFGAFCCFSGCYINLVEMIDLLS